MSIARQFGIIRPTFGKPRSADRPKRADPLIEARQEVKALAIKCARQADEIVNLKRELAKRR
jgi:hypothetical protein